MATTTPASDTIEPVALPWPEGRGLVDGVIRRGDRVRLRHIARPEWTIAATVAWLTTPGRAVTVLPDEPITSPANWVIAQ